MQEDGHGRTWTATANSDLYMRTGYGKPFRRFTGNALGNRQVSIMFLDSNGVLWAVTQDNNVFFLMSRRMISAASTYTCRKNTR